MNGIPKTQDEVLKMLQRFLRGLEWSMRPTVSAHLCLSKSRQKNNNYRSRDEQPQHAPSLVSIPGQHLVLIDA